MNAGSGRALGLDDRHVLAENGIGVKNTTISIPRLDTGALEKRLEAEQG